MTVQDFLLKIQHKINIVSRPMNSNIATPAFDKRSINELEFSINLRSKEVVFELRPDTLVIYWVISEYIPDVTVINSMDLLLFRHEVCRCINELAIENDVKETFKVEIIVKDTNKLFSQNIYTDSKGELIL